MTFESCTLADLAGPGRNAIVGGPFGSNLVSKDYVESGVPVIRGQNMGSKWVSGEFVFVSNMKAESLRQNIARPNDLVFTQRGTLGQVSIVPEGPHDEYIVSQSQMKITVDPTKVDVCFLYYLFRTPHQLEYIFNAAIQTGVPHTNLGILKSTPVELPALPIQKKTAAILNALDDRIALLHETNATLEAIAQALFKSWFVDFDPVRAKQQGAAPAGIDDATAALFPAKTVELTPAVRPTVSDLIAGGALLIGDGYRAKNDELGRPGLPFVRAGDLDSGQITPTKDYLSLRAVNVATMKMAKPGDTAFTSKGTIGRFAFVDDASGEAVYSPQVCFWRSLQPDIIEPAYLHYWMKSAAFKMQVDAVRGQAAIMDYVSLSDQRRMRLDVPAIVVQRRFAEVAGVLLNRISCNRAIAMHLASLRDTLLPRLISGQLRLPEAAVMLAET